MTYYRITKIDLTHRMKHWYGFDIALIWDWDDNHIDWYSFNDEFDHLERVCRTLWGAPFKKVTDRNQHWCKEITRWGRKADTYRVNEKRLYLRSDKHLTLLYLSL
jgi:hypothetical protein